MAAFTAFNDSRNSEPYHSCNSRLVMTIINSPLFPNMLLALTGYLIAYDVSSIV
ncbi:hypothetical protein CYLTODRAFT_416908 [Cylindrobasidium torrendii FP15055 ss-10]|uniref:Uncharacterized protein n=1 Tax=Cylindrobasidium torrendii FP15055 ss-10 TaxID=1314674 RepID=A0A0D7BTM5_9AGAR|nr:hypothetical protein CYLTODRAFT_416908 [Cylindrobasidium torrendii FP15055 ss-10]